MTKAPQDITTARAAKLALVDSKDGMTVRELLRSGNNEVFRRLVDGVKDYAIFLLTPDGIVVSWNTGAERIKGYTADEIIGKHFSTFYTNEALQRDWPAEELRRAEAMGHFEDEGWRVRKDGTRFWANAVISPVRGNQGELLGFSKVTRDLTERRENERRLQHSERSLRLLVDSVQDYAIFQLDTNGIITTWNLGAQRIKGYQASEVLGKHFSIFYPPDAAASGWPQEELRRATEKGRFEDEGWRVRRDGTRLWANVVITAMRDESGQLLGFSKVTRDLTERRRHEELLREREENLRLLVEGVKDHAMFLLDARGFVKTWNLGAQRVLGHAAGQVLDKDVSTLYPTDEVSAGRPRSMLVAAQSSGHAHAEGWRQKADGNRFWAETSTTVLRDTAGTARGFVQIVRDLTERRRVETLESEGRRISEFIAMLSHELRNPLAPIRNAMSILKRLAQQPEAQWCVELVGRQVNHMTRLVDDLLDVSRITSGKIRLEAAPIEFNTLVRTAVDSVRAMLQGHSHTLTFEPHATPLTVNGDSTRLTQVVVNLLTNACKYTPAGGMITVRIGAGAQLVTMQVVDNGIGMSEVLLRHAFDPFVQGARTLDRSEGGLGIGLTLVRKITELHGGTAAATSAGPGLGTTMTITLPLADAHSTQPADQESLPVRTTQRILVVDDNQDAAESLAMILRLDGHEVQVAYDGPQAISFAAATRPQVVLMDIGLPGMNGLEVAKRLKDLPGLANTRLIAVTGYGQEGDRQATLEAGFHFHLTKPVDPEELGRLL